MKKLVLKKDVVARIDNGSMNQLKGGLDTYNVCYTMGATCTGANTCEPMRGCEGDCSGIETCGAYTGLNITYNPAMSCKMCVGSGLATLCETACGLQCQSSK